MLTNILFGQARSNAADPPSVKATESPTRQQGSRSFSDHLRDRARRDETNSVSEKKPNKQPEKAAERRDVDDGPKRADQDKPKAAQATTAPDTGTSPGMTEEMLDGEGIAATEVLAAGAESDLAVDDLPVQAAESAEPQEEADAQIPVDAAEAVTQEAAIIPPVAPQASDVKAGVDEKTAEVDVKTGGATAGNDAKLPPAGEQTKTGAMGMAAKSDGLSQVADTLTLASKDTAPAETRKTDTVQQPVRSAAEGLVIAGAGPRRSEAGNTAGTTADAVSKGMGGTVAGQPAQALANANAAATPTQAVPASAEPEPTLGQSAGVSEEAGQRLASAGNGTVASQRSVDTNQPRLGPKVAAAGGVVSASAKAGESSIVSDAVSAKVAQSAQANADVNVEAAVRDASGKAAPSGEALMAAAGQSRAAAAAEPGRRAQGRESESREAQASTTSNGTGISAGSSAAAAAKAAAIAQVSAVQQAFAAQVLGADASAAAAAMGDGLLLGAEAGPETPGLSQLLTEAVLQPGTVHRPETPRLIATQLAQALVAKGERNVEVALNPEELGRVKMRVTTSDTGITVVIQTERPETGDLMRRHINELADEFRRMGFDNVSFEFSGGGTSDGQGHSEGDGQSAAGGSPLAQSDDMAAAPVAETPTQQLRMGNAGLDMRV